MHDAQAANRWTHRRLLQLPLVAGVTAVTSMLALSPAAMASGGGGGGGGGGGTTTSGADLRLTGSLSASQVPPGATFTETYVIVNRGPQTATGVGFGEFTNSFIGFVSGTVNGVRGCSANCIIGDMASGAQATVVLTETAPNVTDPFDNDGFVFSQTPDPQTLNNDARLTIQVTTNAGGGTTTPPPTSSGPCAFVVPSSATQTQPGTLNKMSTKITNCGSTTLTDIAVVWDPGSSFRYAFGCTAPQISSGSPPATFTLAAGATLQVNCQTATLAGAGQVFSGDGTVTVYDQCRSADLQSSNSIELNDVTLVPGGRTCDSEPETLLSQADFSWNIDIPANQPPQGGNRGGG